jgi:GxxExxY protein
MHEDHMNSPSPASRTESIEADLSRKIIGGFYTVYNHFGYGLLECHYARALELELNERGLLVEREYPVAVAYKGHQIGQHRLDMLVERRIVIEIKATERIPEFARRQLRNYVTLTGRDLGILLHFGPKPFFYRELGGFRPANRIGNGGNDNGNGNGNGNPNSNGNGNGNPNSNSNDNGLKDHDPNHPNHPNE